MPTASRATSGEPGPRGGRAVCSDTGRFKMQVPLESGASNQISPSPDLQGGSQQACQYLCSPALRGTWMRVVRYSAVPFFRMCFSGVFESVGDVCSRALELCHRVFAAALLCSDLAAALALAATALGAAGTPVRPAGRGGGEPQSMISTFCENFNHFRIFLSGIMHSGVSRLKTLLRQQLS